MPKIRIVITDPATTNLHAFTPRACTLKFTHPLTQFKQDEFFQAIWIFIKMSVKLIWISQLHSALILPHDLAQQYL